MGRRNKERVILESVEIQSVAAEGKALARVDNMVVFMPYGAPGDIVDVQILKKRKQHAEGRIVRYVKYSDERCQPFCEHFGVCGGCQWQHLPYEAQLRHKQQQVLDNLKHIAKVELPECRPILGSENIKHYRNKLEFTFSDKPWRTAEEMASEVDFATLDQHALGFHIPGMFDKVLDIKHCYLQETFSDELRLFIRRFCVEHDYEFFNLRQQEGLMRNMIVRTASTGEKMLIVVFYRDEKEKIQALMQAIADEFPQITSLLYVINNKGNDTIFDRDIHVFKGRDYIMEQMENLQFKVGPKSFYQTNSAQAYRLYSVVREMADLQGDELVYDLYTGTGTIANFVSAKARQVIGVEYVPEAIEDAKVNADINHIDNTLFFAGDVKDIVNDAFIEKYGRPDVLITDPPRAGMHTDVINTILKARPRKIVYVSCNPATQARDINLLDVAYRVDAIQPVDMFPHTQHVENV
ncbi:MAG: 23S rRNA (uracil(1939)-C(5))-methyltransferase RlmD, partial [Bacteroidales bacterium]|nr:23S rRNA (uracil(1939)-C(5))-methyltransferase RlmD [Bacteroidales bacterium]